MALNYNFKKFRLQIYKVFYIDSYEKSILNYLLYTCVIKNNKCFYNILIFYYVDIDEFIFFGDDITVNSNSLINFLKGYEAYGGLQINWRMFGNSGHIKRPKGEKTIEL